LGYFWAGFGSFFLEIDGGGSTRFRGLGTGGVKVNKSFFSVGTLFCVYMRLTMCEKDLGLAFARCYGGAFVCVSSRLAPLLGLWAGALEDGWGNFWDDCAVWVVVWL
jgi:hypothetical protein